MKRRTWTLSLTLLALLALPSSAMADELEPEHCLDLLWQRVHDDGDRDVELLEACIDTLSELVAESLQPGGEADGPNDVGDINDPGGEPPGPNHVGECPDPGDPPPGPNHVDCEVS